MLGFVAGELVVGPAFRAVLVAAENSTSIAFWTDGVTLEPDFFVAAWARLLRIAFTPTVCSLPAFAVVDRSQWVH